MADKGKDEDEDPRLAWMYTFMYKSMRLRPDRWSKMLGTDEYAKIVMNFINNRTRDKVLTMTVLPTGVLLPIIGFPPSLRNKGVYFIKKDFEPITKDNIRERLLFGDLSPKPIDSLGILFDEIAVPVLTNQKNHISGWPKVIVDGIFSRTLTMRNSVSEIRGEIDGQTLLSMPQEIKRIDEAVKEFVRSDGEKVDVYTKGAVERIVVKWVNKINDVLGEESEKVMHDVPYPTPAEEKKFWEKRVKNIECIFYQLEDPKVKKIGSLLELTKSAYYPSYMDMFRKVISALQEAREINLYLKPLMKHIDKMGSLDFIEIEPYLKPLMHVVCLIWANSKYYRADSTKLVTLLKSICNLFIDESSKFLDPSAIFQRDVNECHIDVSKCLHILEEFVKEFEESRLNISQYFKGDVEPVQWNFHTKQVFQRMNLFKDRLQNIETLFQSTEEFLRLERIEFGGIKGRVFSTKVATMLQEFNEMYNVFRGITYDPLDPEDPSFDKDYDMFHEKVADMDRRLATIFNQAIEDCPNVESFFKCVDIIGPLVERSSIHNEVVPSYKMILDMLNENLDKLKEIHDDHLALTARLGYMPVDTYYPPVAGALQWIQKINHRIAESMEKFHSMDDPVNQTAQARHITEKHNELKRLLRSLEKRIFNKWASVVPRACRRNLKKTLITLTTENDKRHLELNFHDQLIAVLREVRYMTLMEKEKIPEDALNLFSRNETLRSWICALNIIIYKYNTILENSLDVELNLIMDEIKSIDELVDWMQSELTWNSEDAWKHIRRLKRMVEHLYSRLTKSQSNKNRIKQLIEMWTYIPLYERKDKKKENLLYLEDRAERVQKRYNDVTQAGKEIHKLMEESYKLLFHTQPPPEESDSDEKLEVEDTGKEEHDEDDDDDDDSDDYVEDEGKETATAEIAEGKETATEPESDMETTITEVDQEEKKKDIKKEETTEEEKSEGESERKTPEPLEGMESHGIDSEFLEHLQSLARGRETEWCDYVFHIDGIVADGLYNAIVCSYNVFSNETDIERVDFPFLEIKLHLVIPNIVFTPSVEKNDEQGLYTLVKSLLVDVIKMSSLVDRIDKEAPDLNYMKDMVENGVLNEMELEILSRVELASRDAKDFADTYNKYSYLWLDNRQELLNQFVKYGRYLTGEDFDILEKEGLKEVKPSNAMFKEKIDHYNQLYNDINKTEEFKLLHKWLKIDVSPLKQGILKEVSKWADLFKQHLYNHVVNSLKELEEFTIEADREMLKEVKDGDYDGLLKIMSYLYRVRERQAATDDMFEPLKSIIDMLKPYGVEFPNEIILQLQDLPEKWNGTKKIAVTVRQTVAPLMAAQVTKIRRRLTMLEKLQSQFRDYFKKQQFFRMDCKNVYSLMDSVQFELNELEKRISSTLEQASIFEIGVPEFKVLTVCKKELKMLKELWDYVFIVQATIDDWKETPWKNIDVEAMDMECKKYAREIKGMDRVVRTWDTYVSLESSIKNLLTSLRAVTELQNPAIRDRHWDQLMSATKVKFKMDDETTLSDLLALNLHNYQEEVSDIVDQSIKEMSMEKVLKELHSTWSVMAFLYEKHPRTGLTLLKVSDETIETLEENQVALQNMLGSRYIALFQKEVSEWQQKLANADQVLQLWFSVQRTWMHLESIFIGSEDIRIQLPQQSKVFEKIDHDFRVLLSEMLETPNIVEATNKPKVYDRLLNIEEQLSVCEKALSEYLETKRLAYPRFYFISSVDLLDILSTGNQPELVARHLTKLYDSMARLRFIVNTKTADAMWSKDGEFVKLFRNCDCTGNVETWLNRLTDTMRYTVRMYFAEAVESYEESVREEWIFDYPAQAALCGTQIWWTTEVNIAFARLGEGYEYALRDYQRKQINQLSNLITLLLGDLTPGDRQKIMTICTIDVHSRDVVAKLMQLRVMSASDFQWQCQLRHRWNSRIKHCFCNICDAQFKYQYEYLGNTPRLVITPLTDRCYITLTQSLHLVMGGAPAGPAGTGKTETTKDLGRAMGVMVYVFNCSEQMDYKSCGNMYKGLAQTGAWGCCDEFNRIAVEVLSVVAVQVKSVLDAIKGKRKKFNFMGETIGLIPTVGMFITMNPGYAGRTELPENLKALFRPCAMVVPDFALICEIMLVAEGFQDARLLARKFITLYMLCRELLSKQDHYDWGLRAIKSVLVVAGALKRGDRGRPEDQVLMRALRDFNIPKIVTDDLPVFMGLIGDLFPALDVPRKRDFDFEAVVKKSVLDLKLQAEDNFVLKIVQLEELLAVRHSVFIVGNAGTGKTMVWRCLYATYQNQKRKPIYSDLNPKAVTNNELFGYVHPSSREWMDGLVSIILRNQANMTSDSPKWIVLDGDIDPMWIESLNTVMDDNKVLTLASNERIALTKEMRLIFEIASLRTATPATVSRAGILYINPQDLGWNPYVASWIETTREEESERANLIVLFDKYVPACLDILKGIRFKRITPIPEISHIRMLCQLLECLLIPSNVPKDCPNEWYETYFVFSSVWAFGSALYQDELVDYRSEFSKWWTNEFKVIKFPSQGTVFDYYVHNETKRFLPWTDLVQPFTLEYEIPLQSTLVSTAETTRLRYFMDMFLEVNLPVMLVGNAGTGKSVIVSEKLSKLSEDYAVTNVPFNFYTTSEMLQKVLEKPLEKKAGRNFGPVGNKTMIYFVDDMNMPEVDLYGTVQPHTLIRQYIDYGHWYDRDTLTLKNINNCQFVSCMNPTAGSFTINPRLQRHFSVFALCFPSKEPLTHIYKSVLQEHLENPTLKIPVGVQSVCGKIVDLAVTLHTKVSHTFLPTAVKFHYAFNLRDLSNIFQGMLFAGESCLKNRWNILRLWMHEATRVYGDKLVDTDDVDYFKGMLKESVQKAGFENLKEEVVFEEPLIHCHFAEGIGDGKYMPIADWTQLNKLLTEAMSQYNDLVGALNLVLFSDAMQHVCRISRILESPRGNALLVGVGGSGKQSLSRLASFICGLEVFQVQLRKGYSIVDLKADIAQLYLKSGLKGLGNVFLMTDAQVDEEIFLVLINDMLASGEIPELFPDEDVDNIVGSVRNEVKSMGIYDSKENCWKFFIDRVRRQLKVVLCFSPVGDTLRVRSRKFPAIVNCTAINWFHEWPQTALESVSERFLREIEVLPMGILNSVSLFMAYVHTSVNEMSEIYLSNERRYNYTTPKSFLEQISLYSKLLTEQTQGLNASIDRLVNGLEKLDTANQQIAVMKVELAEQEVEVKIKSEKANEFVEVLITEKEKVDKEKAIAAEEEANVRKIEEDVSAQQQICEQDLMRAEPALAAAEEALATLNKDNLTELKSFGSPTEHVVNVVRAVMILFSKGKIAKEYSWKDCKVFMGKVGEFLHNLQNYDKENIPQNVYDKVLQYVKNPNFTPDFVMRQSFAAAGLCSWVINIIKFYDVYVIVEPKRRALNQANKQLAAAREKLKVLNDRINALQEKLNDLQEEYDKAMAEKERIQAEADKTARRISNANRLVTGLASEGVRWTENVEEYKKSRVTLPGDILLLTAFLSYVGCFTRRYRIELLHNRWLPFLKSLTPAIPIRGNSDLLSLLTDDAKIAEWNNQGLPSDRMSTENATILVNSARWPLIIDPQLQGINWIKNKYGSDLKVIRLGQKSYLDIIETAVFEGDTLLIENIGETIEAVLDPLLSRAFIKKGTAIKIGDKEVDFNPKFRLILHTKLANPHYKPEMQAQTTLINFTVTKDGLEEQLLAEVVKYERPELESKKAELTKQQNDFKITLKKLEDDLLHRLSTAGENIVEDEELIDNLETTTKTSKEIVEQVKEAKIMGEEIDFAREQYRPAAGRASLLYFVMNDLHMINPIYQFSLKAFSVVFQNAIYLASKSDDEKIRLLNLIDSITYFVYMYTSRGLFERDKLIFLAQMAFQILLHSEEIKSSELDFLLRCPSQSNLTSPVDFLSNSAWGSIMLLVQMSEFKNLDRDIEGSAKRWKALVDMEAPEKEKLPQDWKNKTPLQQLCIMRILRPDRMTYAVRRFVELSLGTKYVESRTVDFSKSYEETSSSTPVFFILSPGVDPLNDVESHGKKLGFTMDKGNFHNVSLGQGQEVVAEAAMDTASEKGHWVILQNVHLVQKWLPTLDKKLEECSEGAHTDYRLFISAEPAADPAYHIIPQGVLESSIKITNEPPTGMKANLHKALDCFNQETLEMCSKETEFKSILFALCYFHAVVAERRKFGAQGWNRVYPFNVGDLTICVNVLYNYLEKSTQVPWDDLRYLFGEIMYGGHITDDWDRRLCRTFLQEYMQPQLLDGELYFATGFQSPPNLDYKAYHAYISDYLPAESPHLYGLHPNAEIGFLTTTSNNLFRTVFEMQPRDVGETGADTVSKEDKVKQLLEEILDKVPEPFNMAEIMAKVEERTPYVVVAFQECERMNFLTIEMRRSLREVELGLKGELTITPDMEKLMESLFMDAVPDNWTKRAYASMLTLGPWIADLSLRIKELEAWSADFSLPNTIWLAGFFNPQSFLTAIMQSTARKNEWPLDRMCLSCDVTRKQKDEFTAPPREGAYVHGLFMEGARWDSNAGGIVDAKLKELFPQMPVIFIKAITQDKQDLRNVYECPVYKTRIRGPTFVWTFNLKTKQKAAKWTLAGVALLLQI